MRQLLLFCRLSLVVVLLSCERESSVVIDPFDPPPILLQSSISPAAVNTDTINIGPERLPGDILPIQLRIEAKFASSGASLVPSYALMRSRQEPPLLTGQLSDNGTGADSISGDSVYTATVTLRIARSEIGVFSMEISAEDSRGSRSNAALLPFTIVRLNQPPQLSNLQAPDTVKRSTTDTLFLLFSVKAIDPDGQQDIRRVTRTTPSGLVLDLNDAGTNGDAAAGDSIYTETVALPPNFQIGSYQFRFQAVDKSNAASAIVYHTIEVIP